MKHQQLDGLKKPIQRCTIWNSHKNLTLDRVYEMTKDESFELPTIKNHLDMKKIMRDGIRLYNFLNKNERYLECGCLILEVESD